MIDKEKKPSGEKTIGEIIDSLNEEQRAAVAYLLYNAKNRNGSGKAKAK